MGDARLVGARRGWRSCTAQGKKSRAEVLDIPTPEHKAAADKSQLPSDEGWRRERGCQAGRRSHSSMKYSYEARQAVVSARNRAERDGDGGDVGILFGSI